MQSRPLFHSETHIENLPTQRVSPEAINIDAEPISASMRPVDVDQEIALALIAGGALFGLILAGVAAGGYAISHKRTKSKFTA